MNFHENWERIKEIADSIPMPNDGDAIFLFGSGLQGSLAITNSRDELDLTAICDNNQEKHGTTIEGLPCIPPQKLHEYPNPFVLVSTVKYYPAVHQQLTDMGIRHCGLDAYVVRRHWREFEEIFHLLDDTSKEVYAGILLCRVSGDLTNAEKYCCDNQYFCLPRFRYLASKKGAFINCGAYVGDTLEEMVKNSLGTASKIFAFEPSERAFHALKKRAAFLCDIWAMEPEQIVCENKAVGKVETTQSFLNDRAIINRLTHDFTPGAGSVEVVSLDKYLLDNGNPDVALVVADIEGAELEMLHGARNTIAAYTPKLAICIYHSIYDMFRIPLFLKELVPNYQLKIRHHEYLDGETVLYCYI